MFPRIPFLAMDSSLPLHVDGADKGFNCDADKGNSSSAFPSEDWKQKLNMLLNDQSKQELVSREKKDRRDFQQIETLASKMGLYSHMYAKVVVVSKAPLPNYRYDLDDKRRLREVNLPTTLLRQVDGYLQEYLTQKSRRKENFSDLWCATPADSGGTDEGLFEPPKSLSCSRAVVDKFLCQRSSQMRDQQRTWQESPDGRKILEFRSSLPAYKEKEAILSAISRNQVLIISGETGCGKTTQVPQFILESEIELVRGAVCNIICTQPRRIAAISVSERVAFERGEKLGETVGYKVRLEGMQGRDTHLLFCTTGILLRRLLDDKKLKGITHIIVDEIHERGINEDFLLVVLKDLLAFRPELKLILMSATLDAELFSSYFNNASTMKIPGFTYPVRTQFLEDILEISGYRLTPDNQIDDYGPERIWKMNKQLPGKRKSQLSSALEDVLRAADFNYYSPQTSESLSCWNPDFIGFNLIQYILCNICEHERPGAILVFMIGWDDINALKEKLLTHPVLSDPNRVLLVMCHGSMDSLEQRLIFQEPEDGVRKIVLATNIAETSITINDIVFVIDCGKAKESSYDALNNTCCLLPTWISKVSVQQVQNAIEYLKTIGALDENENLTILGRHLVVLPMEPKLGKMLIFGVIFNCLDPILTIVAGLTVRCPFLTPSDKKDLAQAAKSQFSHDYSDHLAIVRAYDSWKDAEIDNAGHEYCWKNFLSPQSMKVIEALRVEFLSLLKDIGLVDRNMSSCNAWSYDMYLIRAAICYGLYPGICSVVHKDKSFSLKTTDDGKVLLHSNSVNARESRIPYPWLVFNEKIKVNSVFLRDSTAVPDSVVLLFGGSISKGDTDGHLKMSGGYLEFFVKPAVAEMYQSIRKDLDRLIHSKLQFPQMSIHSFHELLFAIRLLICNEKCEGKFVYSCQLLKPSMMTLQQALVSRTTSGPGGDNTKGQLQTLLTRAGYGAPFYTTTQLKNNQFRATVEFNGVQIMGQPYSNKKNAEKDAAAEALQWLMGIQTGNEDINHMTMLLKKRKTDHN
ncbi:DExH-box ATP-dependent RNA helicase DExH5, mitochondrial isoform X3 [Vigna angularis]|uniref:DExH-box ATP-dependent RNA helicase DExH5, mitochondrial isoform X3 n=1 Tax=Phaseolus angularis TaxID=3914 RepID=UPI00080A03AF|nr:DExH-box ATP-dependent RNA helicase DExH5, mitochondrial isoform X3 [Vigna angularis]